MKKFIISFILMCILASLVWYVIITIMLPLVLSNKENLPPGGIYAIGAVALVVMLAQISLITGFALDYSKIRIVRR